MRKSIPIIIFLIFELLSIFSIAETPKTDQPKRLSSQEKIEAKSLIKKYFESKDLSAKQDILNELSKYNDRLAKSDVSDFVNNIWPLTKIGPQYDGKSPSKCTHPDYPGTYLITVPGSAKSGGKVGIFIGLHGGGQDQGEGSQIKTVFGTPDTKLIAVFPTVIKKEGTAWNTEREERYVLEIIADLKRTYNIDTNQVYLAGHSMGGYGTWSIGGNYADLFAAISPGAGGILVSGGPNTKMSAGSGTVANLKNTPIWFYHSADDKQVSVEPDRLAFESLKTYKEKYGPYDYVYKEYTDIGHGFPKEGFRPIWNWMFSKKRNPYPKFVIWEPSRSYKKIFYWLKIDNPNLGRRIEAKIDNNKISVQGSVQGLTIFLNEKLVNLTKPVVVTVNDNEEFNGTVGYSLDTIVETIDDKKDPEMYFTSKIEIK